MADMAILFDTSRCSGCHACQVACKVWNGLPSSLELNGNKWSGSHQNPSDVNGTTRLIMLYNEMENPDYATTGDVSAQLATKRVKWAFGRRACQHCTDAACISICPAGAVFRDEETGFVTTDNSKCIGCQYCSAACPFDVPRYDEGVSGTIQKCSGCVDRIANGMSPACVTTCQPEALSFGERKDMIKEAYKRLNMLKERGYSDAMVYGEKEMGGLHVIQVLKYGAAAHGAVENPSVSPAVTLTNVAKPVTAVVFPLVIVAFGVMAGLAHGYKRDTLVYNSETKDTISLETGEAVKTGLKPMDERGWVDAIFENMPFMAANKKKEKDPAAPVIVKWAKDDEEKGGE